jgi:uncharacterized DUF497 family protein
MPIVFAWDDWNREHVKKHGATEGDATHVIEHVREPFPRQIGEDKYLVWGQNAQARHLQVVFAFKLPEELEFTSLTFLDWSALIDYDSTVAIYVIHCMPLTARQLRQYRKLWSDN